MGRPSLYATDEERRLAKSKKAREWGQTEAGKELRSRQNRQAYERRRKRPPLLRLRLQYIPSFIRQLAKEPIDIKTQSLFDEHFYSGIPITTDDEFKHWESNPPYSVSEGLVNIGLDDTVDAVHGRRMRLQLDRERELVEHFTGNNRVDVWCEVHRDIFHLIGEAKKLKRQLDEIGKVDKESVNYVMGMHFLFWKARAIMSYTEYWRILRSDTSTKQDVLDYFEEVWYTPPTPESDSD